MKYLDWKPSAKDYYVCDIETDGLSPTVIWCSVCRNLGSDEVLRFYPDDMGVGGKFVQFLESAPVLVGHNYLSFDNEVTGRLLGYKKPVDSVIDSLVLSYLYHPHLPDGHSLEAYGNRFGIKKIGHDDWSRFSPEMMARCERDVELTAMVYKGLCERMNKIGYSEKSCLLEHEIRDVINRQQARGFYFDRVSAFQRRGELERQLSDLAGPIETLFPPVLTERGSYNYRVRADGEPYESYARHVRTYDAVQMSSSGNEYSVWSYQPFDIGSPQQRIKKLLSLGWQPTELTPAGNPKVNEDELKKFADSSGIPEITAIADWVVRNSRLSTINSWLGFCQDDSRIHGTVFTCGAGSRRMRHVQPNTANIPSEANEAWWGKEMRELWAATPGRTLMGYDASGLEMRGFCHVLWLMASKKDREFLYDQYIVGKPHKKNAEALTDALGFPVVYGGGGAKTLFYAFLYGGGDRKLGVILGKGPGIGKKVRATLLSSVPGLRDAVEAVQAEWDESGGLIRTVDGGYVRCPGRHAALNYQIQSAGGIVMKEASVIFDKEIARRGLDIWKVGDIHDESQQDCDPKDADEAGKIGVQSIRDAGESLGFNVPLDGEYKIGANWHCTH